jgi:hypothetical protein
MSLTLEEARERRRKALLEDEKEMLFESIESALPELFRHVEAEEEKKDQLRRVIWYFDEFSDPFAQCVKEYIEELGPGTTERVCGTLADLIRAYGRGERIALSGDTQPPEIDQEFAEFLLSIPREAIDKFQLEVANARR